PFSNSLGLQDYLIFGYLECLKQANLIKIAIKKMWKYPFILVSINLIKQHYIYMKKHRKLIIHHYRLHYSTHLKNWNSSFLAWMNKGNPNLYKIYSLCF